MHPTRTRCARSRRTARAPPRACGRAGGRRAFSAFPARCRLRPPRLGARARARAAPCARAGSAPAGGVEPAWRRYSGNRISSSCRKCATVSVKNASTYAHATASRCSGPASAARSKRLAYASSWWCSSDSGTSAGWRFTVSAEPGAHSPYQSPSWAARLSCSQLKGRRSFRQDCALPARSALLLSTWRKMVGAGSGSRQVRGVGSGFRQTC